MDDQMFRLHFRRPQIRGAVNADSLHCAIAARGGTQDKISVYFKVGTARDIVRQRVFVGDGQQVIRSDRPNPATWSSGISA